MPNKGYVVWSGVHDGGPRPRSGCQTGAVSKRTDERRERAVALGPPTYGLAGQKPLDEFGSSGFKDETTALRLKFGTKGRRPQLGVETTTEPGTMMDTVNDGVREGQEHVGGA
jgi:hypothetical protein